jgi:hypothetical protein
MKLNKEHSPYAPSAKTDVLATFRRMGWTPPSELLEFQQKWDYYKRMYILSDEALHETTAN